jgi:hypothetical protein
MLTNLNFSFSQCSETDKTKVMLIGDSWAFFMNADNTINDVFDQWGHTDIEYYTNLTLSENGAETVDFLETNKQVEMASQLLSRPEIEVVHLSLGGNDVLGSWNINFTQTQTDSLKNEVKDSLIAVVDFIKSVRPDVKILWSGYVYPNFEEVISGAWFPSQHPFYGTWEGMEFPDNETINLLLNSFSSDIENYYLNDTTVDFVNVTGLMQYTYGQSDALGVAPFGVYPAFTVPLPEGYVDYPSPKDAMRNYGITKDCFHLSVQGYEDLISYHTQKFYHKFFMEDVYFIAEDDNRSGSASSQGNTTSSLLLGEQNGESFSTVLNFGTTLNLDYEVEEASLFLRRKSQIGGNPISDSMIIEIKTGAFGSGLALEGVDFSAPADEFSIPCVFGQNYDDYWVRLDLPQALLQYISVNNETQIRLTAPNNPGSLVEFYGLDDPDFAPVLDIVYGQNPVTSVDEFAQSDLEVNVYPNPANDYIVIETNQGTLKDVAIFDLKGSEMGRFTEKKIDVSNLERGAYIISVVTNEGVSNHKIIKK